MLNGDDLPNIVNYPPEYLMQKSEKTRWIQKSEQSKRKEIRSLKTLIHDLSNTSCHVQKVVLKKR